MKRKSSFVLKNGRSFKSKKDAIEHYRKILYGYPHGIALTLEDHVELFALLERHPESDSKIGCGIAYFTIENNIYGTPGFWLHRTDGTSTDFSFLTAIRGTQASVLTEFRSACRNAVSFDVAEFKRKYFHDRECAPCQATGTPLTIESAHVDHERPQFIELVEAFRKLKGWDLEIPAQVISPSADGQMFVAFTDPALAEDFRTFHNEKAELRVVSSEFNLSRPKAEISAAGTQ